MNNFKVTDVRAVAGDAAFLIEYKNTAILYDTGFAFSGYEISNNIAKSLGNKKLDAILLTHSHYDHAAATPYILKRFSDTAVYAGEYAQNIFNKPSAKALMRSLDKKSAEEYGVKEYDDLFDNLSATIVVSDNQRFTVGDLNITAIHLPGHTRCSFGYYIEELKLLLSCETLCVYDGNGNTVPSVLVGTDLAFSSFEKAKKLDIKQMVIPHYGLISESLAASYLLKAQESTTEACHAIKTVIEKGGNNADALNWFKDKFYHGYIKEIYPLHAMELNTNIMIDLIKKNVIK